MSPATQFRIFANVRTQITLLCLLCLPAAAQEPLTLRQAVKLALTQHPSLEAASAQVQAAASRVGQARSGLMPRVQYTEMVQGGNNPVYVFGTLLTQRRFTEANFGLNSLNRPDPLANFQSSVTAEQLVYDFGGRKNSIHAAELGRQMSEQEKKAMELALIAGVAKAYHGVTLAQESLRTAEEALKTAQADEQRAVNVRNAGMATESDVLSIRVHVAAMREQVIRGQANLRVARAALNEALGLPLDSTHQLSTPLTPAPAEPNSPATNLLRPELAHVRLARQAANAQALTARAGYLPQIFLRGVFEADRYQFVRQGGANWMLAGGLKWNLFDGGRTRESVAEAKALSAAAAAGEKQLTSALQLQVLQARAGFQAASERITVTEASVSQAEESLRILRNRYSSGLATITDLLRAQTALLDTKTRRLAAIHDQRLAAIAIEQATGNLNGDSNVLD